MPILNRLCLTDGLNNSGNNSFLSGPEFPRPQAETTLCYRASQRMCSTTTVITERCVMTECQFLKAHYRVHKDRPASPMPTHTLTRCSFQIISTLRSVYVPSLQVFMHLSTLRGDDVWCISETAVYLLILYCVLIWFPLTNSYNKISGEISSIVV